MPSQVESSGIWFNTVGEAASTCSTLASVVEIATGRDSVHEEVIEDELARLVAVFRSEPEPLRKTLRTINENGAKIVADHPTPRGIAAAEGGHMIMGQGAVPIIRNGVIEGACGVGGGTAQQDEDCALAGVTKL